MSWIENVRKMHNEMELNLNSSADSLEQEFFIIRMVRDNLKDLTYDQRERIWNYLESLMRSLTP